MARGLAVICCLGLALNAAVAPQATVGQTAQERAQRVLEYEKKMRGEASSPPPPPPPATAPGVTAVTGKDYREFLEQPVFKFVKFLAPWCVPRDSSLVVGMSTGCSCG